MNCVVHADGGNFCCLFLMSCITHQNWFELGLDWIRMCGSIALLLTLSLIMNGYHLFVY